MNMKKMLACVLALAMLAGMLAGCGSAQTSAVSASQASSASAAAEPTAAAVSEEAAAPAAEESAAEAVQSSPEASAAEAAPAADGSELAVTEPVEGSPWNDTQIIGNVPAEQPAADEDFYTYCNYDYLETHQDAESDGFQYADGGFQDKIFAAIEDESNQSALLDQIRILYGQAMDGDTQIEQGLAEVQPYLDSIYACTTLDELTALLTGDDFPFNPFLTLTVGPNGMKGNNIVSIEANYLFTETATYGGLVYRLGEITEDTQTWPELLINGVNDVGEALSVFQVPSEDLQSDLIQMVLFESAYGKDAYYAGMSGDVEYGTLGDYTSYLSMDELQQLAGNFPIREILTKYGCENSESYAVTCSAWLQDFGALYTEDNLAALRNIVAGKVCLELQNVLQYGFAATEAELAGQALPDFTDAMKLGTAYQVLSNSAVLSNEMGSYFLSDMVSEEDQERLTTMVENIRDAYAEMVESCDWIDDTTREAILLKLEQLRMNVLQPENGYDDYSDLKLVASEDGGTLFTNYLLLKDYNWQKQAARVGKAADSNSAWYYFGASTMNAFYDASTNSINIVPGALNDATFTADMTDTEMYAAIGSVVGHEISHGFDIAGSQYDADGLPNIIFSDEDKAEYLEKVSALENYFSGISVEEGANVSGAFVSAEATADLCGIRSALKAIEEQDPQVDYADFFETYATMWSGTLTETTTLLTLQSDTHNLYYIRVNADCQMMDEFYDTYDVTEGDGMYLSEDERLSFWW